MTKLEVLYDNQTDGSFIEFGSVIEGLSGLMHFRIRAIKF